jgi:hypothetical protein
MKKFDLEQIAQATGALLVIIGISFLIAYPIMWLWNVALVPAAPMLQPIEWLQAWGIRILFGLCTRKIQLWSKS